MKKEVNVEGMEAKKEWLRSIGAAEFPEPIKFIYTFPEYNGSFNLSENYVRTTSLEELKEQYQKNKDYVEQVIKAGKMQSDFFRDAQPL